MLCCAVLCCPVHAVMCGALLLCDVTCCHVLHALSCEVLLCEFHCVVPCCVMYCNVLLCNVMWFVLLHLSVLCDGVLYCMLCCTVQYTILGYDLLCYVALWCDAWYYAAIWCAVFYCICLWCMVVILYCTMMCCAIPRNKLRLCKHCGNTVLKCDVLCFCYLVMRCIMLCCPYCAMLLDSVVYHST